MIFEIMLHPTVGIVNKMLGLDINWLNNPNTALYCVAILTAWLNSGINFLYFSADLEILTKPSMRERLWTEREVFRNFSV